MHNEHIKKIKSLHRQLITAAFIVATALGSAHANAYEQQKIATVLGCATITFYLASSCVINKIKHYRVTRTLHMNQQMVAVTGAVGRSFGRSVSMLSTGAATVVGDHISVDTSSTASSVGAVVGFTTRLHAIMTPFKQVELVAGGTIALTGFTGHIVGSHMGNGTFWNVTGDKWASASKDYAHAGYRIALSASNLRTTNPWIYGSLFTLANLYPKFLSLPANEEDNFNKGMLAVATSGTQALVDMHLMNFADASFVALHQNYPNNGLLNVMTMTGHGYYHDDMRAIDEILDGPELRRWISRSSELVGIIPLDIAWDVVQRRNATGVIPGGYSAKYAGETIYNTLVYQGSRIAVASAGNTGHFYGRAVGAIINIFRTNTTEP